MPFWATYAFLYIPIARPDGHVASTPPSRRSAGTVSACSWYGELAGNETVREGLVNTLIVAVGSTLLATLLGTLLAIGLERHTRSRTLEAAALSPAIMPDIVLAIGLLAFYSMISLSLGLHSVLLAHVVFSTAFVAAVVKARLGHTDPSLEEASRDLGAGAVETFWRITVPSLRPGIIAGALLAFTLSLDEFVIAFFTNGAQLTDPADRHLLDGAVRCDARDQRPGHHPGGRELQRRAARPARIPTDGRGVSRRRMTEGAE